MKLSRRWKIFFTIAVIAAIAAGMMALMFHFQPEQEVEAYKRQLIAKGEKLEFKDAVPPPADPTNNGAAILEDAFKLYDPDYRVPYEMRSIAPGVAVAMAKQPKVLGYDFTNSWDEFEADVAANRPAIDLTYQALTRPRLEFRFGNPDLGDLMKSLPGYKRTGQKLGAAALLDLHKSDTGAAATKIDTMLELVHKNERNGLIISHLVRLAVVAIAAPPTWELLQNTNVTDSQLAQLQTEWTQLDFVQDVETTLVTERAWMDSFIRQTRASRETFRTNFYSYLPSPPSSSVWTWPPDWDELMARPRYIVGEVMWRSSWSYTEELRDLKIDQIILESLRTARTNHDQFCKTNYDAICARISALGYTNPISGFFQILKIPDFDDFGGDFSTVVRSTIRTETARRVVVTAIAIKRFQLRNGRYPVNLGELVPDFLPSIPIDPMSGKPLCYRPDPFGPYLLYSVGTDGKDEGGDPTLSSVSTSTSFQWQNPHARDWVWPRPATPEEIEVFNATQAK